MSYRGKCAACGSSWNSGAFHSRPRGRATPDSCAIPLEHHSDENNRLCGSCFFKHLRATRWGRFITSCSPNFIPILCVLPGADFLNCSCNIEEYGNQNPFRSCFVRAPPALRPPFMSRLTRMSPRVCVKFMTDNGTKCCSSQKSVSCLKRQK